MEQLTQWQIRIEDKLEKVLVQTTMTNGRVDTHSETIEKHGEIIERHGKELNDLSADNNKTKGRDKMIWVIAGILGSIALLLLGWYLNQITIVNK